MKIVFFGDSITAANRSPQQPLGDGYVSILEEMLSSQFNLNPVRVINSGINGNRVEDLLGRYESDVLGHKPDIVVVKIGINDACTEFISGTEDGQLNSYHAGLDKLIRVLKVGLPQAQFFLLTPYYISDTQTDALYDIMQKYCDVVKNMGAKYDLPVLDLQLVFDSAVKLKSALEWAKDQIHPVRQGHILIAEAAFIFLKENLIMSSSQ